MLKEMSVSGTGVSIGDLYLGSAAHADDINHAPERLAIAMIISNKINTLSSRAMVILYNRTPRESLDSLHFKRFYEKVSTNTSCIHPQTLPPTSAAAKYHSLLVYFQILEWKGSGDEIRPLKWG